MIHIFGLLMASGLETFSTSETWKVLFPCTMEVFWHKVVWLSGRIPKHVFLSWVAARDRMVTRDRLLRRGLTVPPTCVLCVGYNEIRHHLFFFIVTTICKCGLSSSLDWISPHHSFSTTGWDGWKTHQEIRMWTWLWGCCTKLASIWSEKKGTQESILMLLVHLRPSLQRLS